MEILKKVSVKRLLKAIRSIVYPLKDNLRTLDDDICIKMFRVCQVIIKRSDKLAESFVPHFHIILPMFEVVKNRHQKYGRVVARQAKKQPDPSEGFVKLQDLKRNVVDIEDLIQETLEYFEKHGGLMAFVTIKKMIPRYESCMFS